MSRRILVVEDHPENRRILHDLLTSADFQLIEAGTAEEALSLAETERPDLILMDIQLPGMDGLEATRRLKAHPTLRAIPVIAVTSYALSGDEASARAAGCDGYVTKPFSPRGLLATIRAFLPQPRQEARLRTPPRILVVDDNPVNVELLCARLSVHGYELLTAADGEAALAAVAKDGPDLVLLDVMMPRLDGMEVCRRLKADPALPFLPVILVTAKADSRDVVAGLEAGADEYLTKPVDQAALVARVKSMLRIKALHDMVREQAARLEAQTARLEAQSAELAEWNRSLERRVAEQLAELERVGRLKRFFSPQLAELIVAGGAGDPLRSHRRDITVVFLDLRGFTAFVETAEPEELMGVLREYHAEMGRLILAHEGTLERFAGDGMMVFFNDPVLVPDAPVRAIRMALSMRARVTELASRWRRRGFDLELGVGMAQGYATMGAIGFEGRWDYAAIGSVTNLAARLCGEARAGQVLASQHFLGAVQGLVEVEAVGELSLKGFQRPVEAYNILRLRT